MKKTLFIGLLILSTIGCKAQIIAVESFNNYSNDLPDGAYIKDVNNVLGKFIGTWKGTYNNNNYQFRIVKYTRISSVRNLKFDKLLIRYKITDTNGTIIEDTTSVLNDSPYIINGSYYETNGTYVLHYQGRLYECGQNGDLFITVNSTNTTKMRLGLYVDGDMIGDCPNGPAQQILPTTGGMELTKQ
jgi:hypothetical protein